MDNFTKAFAVSVLIFFNLALKAQWIPTDGPYDDLWVMDVKQRNSTIFAGTSCGVFAKSVSGTEWEHLNYNPTHKLFFKGDSLFTSFHHGLGIVNVNDPKLKEFRYPYSGSPFINGPSLAFKDSVMFVTSSEGIYLSFDWGTSTQQFINGLDMDTLIYNGTAHYSLTTTDVIATAGYAYCSTKNGVFRTDYSLTAWQKKSNGLNGSLIRQMFGYSNELYALAYDTLYSSVDSGNTWSPVFGSTDQLRDFCKIGSSLYLVADSSILVSSNGGVSWQPMAGGLQGKLVWAVDHTDNQFYASVINDGIYKWTGNQWKKEPRQGMFCTDLKGLRANSSEVIINDWSGVYRKRNDDTWENVSPRKGRRWQYGIVEKANDTIIVMGRYYASPPSIDSLRLFYSSDGASTWQSVQAPVLTPPSPDMKLRYFNGVLYILNGSKLFSSTDFGHSWVDASPQNLWCMDINDLTFFDGQVFLSTCLTSSLLRYDSTVSAWLNEPVSFLAGYNGITDILQQDTALFLVADTNIYRRFANATGWQLADKGLPPSVINDFVAVDKYLFVATLAGVYFTDDYGDNWHAFNDSLPQQAWGVGIDVLNDTLYLATDYHGVYKHPLPTGPVSLQESKNVKDVVRVYPNPASSEFTLVIPSAVDGHFSLADQGGKVLFEGNFRSFQKIQLPQLADGLYILLIDSAGKRLQHKLIIRN